MQPFEKPDPEPEEGVKRDPEKKSGQSADISQEVVSGVDLEVGVDLNFWVKLKQHKNYFEVRLG